MSFSQYIQKLRAIYTEKNPNIKEYVVIQSAVMTIGVKNLIPFVDESIYEFKETAIADVMKIIHCNHIDMAIKLIELSRSFADVEPVVRYEIRERYYNPSDFKKFKNVFLTKYPEGIDDNSDESKMLSLKRPIRVLIIDDTAKQERKIIAMYRPTDKRRIHITQGTIGPISYTGTYKGLRVTYQDNVIININYETLMKGVDHSIGDIHIYDDIVSYNEVLNSDI